MGSRTTLGATGSATPGSTSGSTVSGRATSWRCCTRVGTMTRRTGTHPAGSALGKLFAVRQTRPNRGNLRRTSEPGSACSYAIRDGGAPRRSPGIARHRASSVATFQSAGVAAADVSNAAPSGATLAVLATFVPGCRQHRPAVTEAVLAAHGRRDSRDRLPGGRRDVGDRVTDRA
jgi:hypothetical protein